MPPQRGQHKCLGKLITLHQFLHLFPGKEFHLYILGTVEMLPGNFLHSPCHKTMGIIVGGRGVAANSHNLFPFSSGITGLLKKFPFGCLKRRFPLLHYTSTNLITGNSQAMPVLPLHNILTILGNGYHIHPIGILQNIKLIINLPCRQLYTILPYCKPWPAEQMLAAEYLPFAFCIYCIFHILVITYDFTLKGNRC